jgi:hypothetical protein
MRGCTFKFSKHTVCAKNIQPGLYRFSHQQVRRGTVPANRFLHNGRITVITVAAATL